MLIVILGQNAAASMASKTAFVCMAIHIQLWELFQAYILTQYCVNLKGFRTGMLSNRNYVEAIDRNES